MEADWSVALTADDPVITVPWAAPEGHGRFIDLRLGSHLIEEIEEARARPPLRAALLALNSAASPVWTAKCDAWTRSDELLDPYEMDADPGETAFGAGSYIDLLVRDAEIHGCFASQEAWLRRVTERLRATPATAARVELVMRAASVDGLPGFGVSWFCEGCGADAPRAEAMWARALGAALTVIMESLRTGG